ncbi:MAG: hypothetical protein IJ493_10840 [Clostridia bacterium]|nr:hypothetical protein [Clostridia bacterium]
MSYNPLCLRCHAPMNHIRTASLLTREGDSPLPVGHLYRNEISSLEVDIWCCPGCGHLELFRHDTDYDTDTDDGDTIAQRKCPRCGRLHDIDYPKCPFCKYSYNT